MVRIRFRLRFGQGANAPFVGIRVWKVNEAKDGRRAYRVSACGLQYAADFIAKGLLFMGPRSFTVTLVAPPLKGEAKAALRAALPKFVADLRLEIERRVRQTLLEVKGREVPLFKGHKVHVPRWALTAWVLLLPEKAQEEFDRWLADQWSDYAQRAEEKLEERLEEEDSDLFLEGPNFGDIEERAEEILLSLLHQDRFELVEEEGGLGASLARARRIMSEGVIAPLIRDRAEALRVVEDYQVLRARDLVREVSSTSLDSVDLLRALYDQDYLLEAAVALLNMLGLDWPARILGGKRPEVRGVHPLFFVLEAARLEAAWGRLMDRLQTEDLDLLRAARRFQRLLDEGLSLEEAIEKSGLPVEVALLLTEGPRLAEYLGEDEEEPLLDLDEDTVLRAFQEEALEEAMAAWGFKTSEEALEALETLGEDPIAQAFKADVLKRFEAKRLAVGM
jgi:hypothetical protein